MKKIQERREFVCHVYKSGQQIYILSVQCTIVKDTDTLQETSKLSQGPNRPNLAQILWL